MKKLSKIAVAGGIAAATAAAGLGIAAASANAATAAPAHSAAPACSVAANEHVVESFVQTVLNKHDGAAGASFLTTDAQWSGGTVGVVKGGANVAGVFAGVVAALPDSHITIDDIFGQGDQVVIRVVVTGTQKGTLLGIPASGRHISWDGVDVFQVTGGKISNIWAGDDWTAILNDTGTYKAPWIS